MEFKPDEHIAYVIPLERFVYRSNNKWHINEPVTDKGIQQYLRSINVDAGEISKCLKGFTTPDKVHFPPNYTRVRGWDLQPGEQPIFEDTSGAKFLNTWVKPKLEPAPGEYPTIKRVLAWLTDNDAEGERWLTHWMARKVKNPAMLPKVAVIFATKPGGGKGTLARVFAEMLGPENCKTLDRGALENRFNAKWAGRLFVLADEVVGQDNIKDISQRLKLLIDANTIELEAKGQNQKDVVNRTAWWFGSNDEIDPVQVEREDRRFTVFSNNKALPDDYLEVVDTGYEADRVTITPAFWAEMQAFYHYLMSVEADVAFVSRPYRNEARKELIEASIPSHAVFFDVLSDHGFEVTMKQALGSFSTLMGEEERKEWDLEDGKISTQMIYKVYAEFCRQNGYRALRLNKFGVACRRRGFESFRETSKKGRIVRGYKVPRSNEALN